MKKGSQIPLYIAVGLFTIITLVPFIFALNNSFRTNNEMYHKFFGVPKAAVQMTSALTAGLTGHTEPLEVRFDTGETEQMLPYHAAHHYLFDVAFKGYKLAWHILRPYMINSLFVCLVTVIGVVLSGSVTAYLLSRYKFFGYKAIYFYIISTMMFPFVLTLVPSFMLVKELGLLNTYWAMILPYIAGGQVFAVLVFKSFFDGLPEDLFESARIDGAGHFQLYTNIVVPLSKSVLSVVMVMNVLGTWNNFLWPFITNTDSTHHVIASGLYVLATSQDAQNFSTLFAAYMVSSIPLLIMFVYATKPFIQGITSGAFKA